MLTLAEMEFVSGLLFGTGTAVAMLRNAISFYDPATRWKALVISGAAGVVWFIAGEVFWRY